MWLLEVTFILIRDVRKLTLSALFCRIVAFLRKSDAVSVSLMLNRSDFGGLFPGLGYQLPKTEASDSSILPEHEDSLFVFSHPPVSQILKSFL